MKGFSAETLGKVSTRTATRVAWSMCALSFVLTALGLFLLVLSQSPVSAPVYAGAPVFDYWLECTLMGISFSVVGAVIAPHFPPQNPVGWIFCAIGLLAGMRLFSVEYGVVTLLAEPGSTLSVLPGGATLTWVASWLWVPLIGLFVFLGLLFPDGRPPSPRWRYFAWLVAAVVVAGTVGVALWPETVGGLDRVNHPLGLDPTEVISPAETTLYALALVAASSLLVRVRRSKGVERQQVKWFAYAATVLAVSATLTYVFFEPMNVGWLQWVVFLPAIVGYVGLPAAVGVAILKYRLYSIDLIINRTLVYGSLSAVLAVVYFGSVVFLHHLFRTVSGQESQLAVVASTLAIAALFTPLRRRIQGFIDRSFYRSKYDAAKTLTAFSAKLREETDIDTLSDDLIQVVEETMQPAHVSLWLRSGPILERDEESGEPRG
jgi:hypothetical protein